jgi:Zn-dependent peptidase ImmA (M78 family)
VSIAALVRRSHDLHILSSDEYRNAMKYMSVRGWRKSEPGDRQMGLPEAPRMFDRAMTLVSDEYDESVEDVARSAHLPVADAVELVRAARDRRPKLTM